MMAMGDIRDMLQEEFKDNVQSTYKYIHCKDILNQTICIKEWLFELNDRLCSLLRGRDVN